VRAGLSRADLTTAPPADLLSVMLLDSAFIQESEWARAQRERGVTAGADAPEFELLYTVAQAQACLEQLQGVAYDADVQPHARCAAASAMPATSSARPSWRSG
jgi:hypothetical protein